MRVRKHRPVGVLSILLLFGFFFGGCSGQQQEDEQLEVTQDNQQGQYAENQQNQQGEDNQYADQQEGEDNEYADQQEGEDNQYADQEGEDNQYANQEGGNETENDLQEIIQQMNGQEGENVADGTEEPLQQDLTETAPAMDAGMSGDAGMAAAPDMASASTPLPFQPGGTPAGPALPEMGSKMPYVVQKGDTMAKISSKVYGDNGRWQEMASLSGLSNPSRIYPGDLVYYTLDDSSIAFATAYESVSRNEEQVQPGDTLATIAQRVYGSSSAWRSIWRQNDSIDNPDVVPPGSTVYYISQAALSAEVQKVRSQMAQLAAIKAKKHREIGIAMLNNTEMNDVFASVTATEIVEECMANRLTNMTA